MQTKVRVPTQSLSYWEKMGTRTIENYLQVKKITRRKTDSWQKKNRLSKKTFSRVEENLR